MQRILFGDNQFFGINHRSEEHARAQALRFQDTDAIMQVLDAAFDAGIGVFMCTTHERIAEVCTLVRANPGRYGGVEFYPCMPYAHKYANAVGEAGMLEALRRFLPEQVALNAVLRGGVAVARKDMQTLIGLLVEAEMKMFHGLATPVIFLQNVVTDLLLGLGFHEALRMFADCVSSRYGAEPGFITMNLPKLLDALGPLGIDRPIVCSNINKIGFRMCGGSAAYEAALASRRCRAVAMSVFASGAIPAEEALRYVCAQPDIEAIVFGASSRGNIVQTKRLIEQFNGAA